MNLSSKLCKHQAEQSLLAAKIGTHGAETLKTGSLEYCGLLQGLCSQGYSVAAGNFAKQQYASSISRVGGPSGHL